MVNILGLRGLPVFAAFFLWAFGTGGMQLARPLFAASFGVPVVLVTLIISSNAVAHLMTGPATGFAMDRWGRKPLMLAGVTLRGLSATAEFFAGSYLEFLVLEFIGGIGVSMWTTGSSVLIADLSVVENRGRVVAARSVASRLGFILGPLVGAAIATGFELRGIFLFNAATKLGILGIVLFLIRETRPEPPQGHLRGQAAGDGAISLSVFLSRPFLIISAVAFCVSMMNQGVFQALFPVYIKGKEGFSTADVGSFITIASAVTLVVALPNGYLVDLYGRKSTLVPGLGVLGLSAYLLASVSDYPSALLMVIAYGIGEGICFGASQAYAMDLAPEHRRGSFLGIWSLVSNSGGAVAPLLVGVVAQQWGFGAMFMLLAGLFVLVASGMGLFGPDTRAWRRAAVPAGGHPADTRSR